MKKAIFLDKDGTLIPDVPYNTDTTKITISDQAIDGLKLLRLMGYVLVVVSNQSGVGKGYFNEEDLTPVFDKINQLLDAADVQIEKFYFCPHDPDSAIPRYRVQCNCQKPLPGMITDAAAVLDIDVRASWMIGDILNDVEAGNSAGCRSILLDNGNETGWVLSEARKPFFIASSIDDAARRIQEFCNRGKHEKELAGL